MELVRKIRDRQARQLRGKSDSDIMAFYQRAGEAARQTAKPRGRRRSAEQAV
ncbi:MAG: hypothetical protein ACREA0_07130 [bacterium]